MTDVDDDTELACLGTDAQWCRHTGHCGGCGSHECHPGHTCHDDAHGRCVYCRVRYQHPRPLPEALANPWEPLPGQEPLFP